MKRGKIERRIRKAIDKQRCLNVFLNGCDSYYNLIPLELWNGILLAACDSDFRIDGCIVIPLDRIDAVYRKENRYDEIIAAENILDGFDRPHMDMTSLSSVCGYFLRSEEWVSVDCSGGFFIGRIIEIRRSSVRIKPFDIQGRWLSPVKIPFKDIRDIIFGDMYTRVLSKYAGAG